MCSAFIGKSCSNHLIEEVNFMRKLISLLALVLASAPAFAVAIPEPETYSLLAIGVAAFFMSRRAKK